MGARRPPPATTTLNVRGLPTSHAHEIKRAAAARGLTIARYLGRLVLLHAAVREAALVDARAAAILATLRLESVTT